MNVCDDRIESIVGVNDVHRATDLVARPSTNDGDSRRPATGRQIQDDVERGLWGPFGTELVKDLRTNWTGRATCMARRRRAISSAGAAIVFLITLILRLLLLYFPHFTVSPSSSLFSSFPPSFFGVYTHKKKQLTTF